MLDITVSIWLFLLLGLPYLFLLKKAGISRYWSALFLITPMGFPLGVWLAFPMLALRAWPTRNEISNPYFLAVPQNVFLVAMHVIFPILSLYIIFKKAGYSGWWCLCAFFPPAVILMLWIAALRTSNNEQPSNQ